MKETDRRLKKLDRLFNSQWSKLMESLVEGDLVGLLQAQGIAVERTCTNVKGGRDGRHYEFEYPGGERRGSGGGGSEDHVTGRGRDGVSG